MITVSFATIMFNKTNNYLNKMKVRNLDFYEMGILLKFYKKQYHALSRAQLSFKKCSERTSIYEKMP